MSAPYREPGSAPSEDGPAFNHDYIADVRRDRDPKGTVKGVAILLSIMGSVLGLLDFLLGGSILNWLAMVAITTAFFGLVVFPIAIISLRRQDERMNVADLLANDDNRDPK